MPQVTAKHGFLKRYGRRILCLLIGIFMAAALVKAFLIPEIPKLEGEQRGIIAVSDHWSSFHREEGEAVFQEYRYTVPALSQEDLVLAVEGYYASVQIFLEGELLYDYQNAYFERGASVQWIELPAQVSGQELSFSFLQSSALNGEPEVYLGNSGSMRYWYLSRNLFALIFSSMFIVLGGAMGISSFFMRRRIHHLADRVMLYLGMFILLAGVWGLTDSQLLQFITGRASVVTLVSFLSFMAMPYFLMAYIRCLMTCQKRYFNLLCWLHLANAGLFAFCYLTRVLSFFPILLVSHLLIVLSAAALVFVGVQEIRKFHNPQMKKILAGLLLLLLFGGISLVFFYAEPDSVYAAFYFVGLFLFVLCLVSSAIDRLLYYVNKSAYTDVYANLAFTDSMTPMGNRLAFERRQRTTKPGTCRACIVFDINNLKAVNDSLGHLAGDELIQNAAADILAGFEQAGSCYRIGGDEFVVIMENASLEEVEQRLAGLYEQIRQKNQQREIPLELACGYAVQTEPETTLEQLFQEADARMYRQKRQMKQQKTAYRV